MAEVLPAAEIVVQEWAKTLTSITSLVGEDSGQPNIAGALPSSGGTSMPFLVVSSVPGGLELLNAEGAPVENIIIQIDAYGQKKPEASLLMQTVLAEIREYATTSAPGVFGGATLVGMQKINGPRPINERDHKFIRFTSDIVTMTKPS